MRYVWCPDEGSELYLDGWPMMNPVYGRIYEIEADGAQHLGQCCDGVLCSEVVGIVPVDLPEPSGSGMLVVLLATLLLLAGLKR